MRIWNKAFQVYPNIVEALAQVIHLLRKQRLALHGHQESSYASYNQGNVLTLVYMIAHYYPLLKNDLKDSLRNNVNNLGPKSQNELTGIYWQKAHSKKYNRRSIWRRCSLYFCRRSHHLQQWKTVYLPEICQ